MNLREYKDSYGSFYQLSNLEESPTTIFIHGVGLDNTMWYPQKKYFHKKSVLFYDLINHGQSTSDFHELSFEVYSRQLLDLINELKLEKINLVGFSIGALIAQHFTENFYNRINKLVLIASVFQRSKNQIEIVKKRYNEALNGSSISKDSIKRWFSENYLENNPQVYNFFYNLLERKNNKNFLAAYKIFIESDKYSINYNNFQMPTLIMTGENEVGSTPLMSERISKKIQNSILYIIKNSKHGATIEQSNVVNKRINSFLF